MEEIIRKKRMTVHCRGIIMHEGKMLVVRLAHDSNYACLPGGHLEWGEEVREGLDREIIEELGVKPKIGRLLYVNTFIENDFSHQVEFFFEVTNGADFVGCEKLDRTHAHEIMEICWAGPSDDINLLPKKVGDDLKSGSVMSDEVRYIMNGVEV